MSNNCTNRLIVAGLKRRPEEFARGLELAMYGAQLRADDYYSVRSFSERIEGRRFSEFRFNTNWGPPVDELLVLSTKHQSLPFLLKYFAWESDFRGQMIIKDNRVIEAIRRRGYGGPNYLWADITHPLVDLIGSYVAPWTLAQQAARRLQDAIAIVRVLKETLEDERFANSRYRAYSNEAQVNKTRMGLTAMLNTMIEQAAQISFEGVLVENREYEQCAAPPESLGKTIVRKRASSFQAGD